jgi:hypothetical protein
LYFWKIYLDIPQIPMGFNIYRRIIDEGATLTGSYYTSVLLLYTFQPDGLAGRGIVFLEDIFRHTSNPDGFNVYRRIIDEGAPPNGVVSSLCLVAIYIPTDGLAGRRIVFLEDIFRHTSNPDGFNVYRRIIDEGATLTGSYHPSVLLLYTFQPMG